ncbi:hypothetical protein Flexsi_0423 [Flexistipes sinusarabici DSM 4947]|uniref:Uncharacterized protein n=1 Tax=Flexistipes sinusarabici (strain ATCC 49648 / DSM 4947 / MAS 10) TaxID=717231 RepID=F8E8Y7_FLESM|nr:hypothetical protein [Flexistipes sinusarabici]AEI14111.1 hypothetical protein Flexsi_0423 [Flexistipes sinusarabici DSM 4947]
MKSLKSTNKQHLTIFTALNIAVFWVFIISPTDPNKWKQIFDSLTLKDSLFLSISPILTLVLSGIFSATTKARLVYWRYNYPLPGSEAFSVHMAKDHRIDPDALATKWGPLPSDPKDQNRLWYKIYKIVENDIRVMDSHRDWLLSRDLAAYSVIFLLVFVPSVVGSGKAWKTTLIYIAIMILQYLIILVAARIYGKRFVCNVLSIDSQSN